MERKLWNVQDFWGNDYQNNFQDNIPDFREDFFLHTVLLKQRLLELLPLILSLRLIY